MKLSQSFKIKEKEQESRLQEEINKLKEAHQYEIANLKAKFAIEKQKEIDLVK